ncbi:GTPase ObgE [Gammaproteobacteria bacterium]|nr:GTPase ObgE [Gammaproteobacteria bacterium]
MSDFIDELRIHCFAGNGGNGCVSFRREKYIAFGGPNGGDGGKGGSVILTVSSKYKSLTHLRGKKHIKAESGKHGSGSQKTGRGGEDVIIGMPLGTCIYDADHPSSPMIIDMQAEGQVYTIASGGDGGLGNMRFKSSINRAPRRFTEGKEGEDIRLRLELKVMADVGLLGLPNAGKSSLLRQVSQATPKVADYAFTTIKPYVGVVRSGPYDAFVMADIPGLIEGASKGMGMGDQFLRHLQRCEMLLHVVDITQDVHEQIALIREEVTAYGHGIIEKPIWIVLNKIDLVETVLYDSNAISEQYKCPVFVVSAKDGIGCSDLVKAISEKVLG